MNQGELNKMDIRNWDWLRIFFKFIREIKKLRFSNYLYFYLNVKAIVILIGEKFHDIN